MFDIITMRRLRRDTEDWLAQSHHIAAQQIAFYAHHVKRSAYRDLMDKLCQMPWQDVFDMLRRQRQTHRRENKTSHKSVMLQVRLDLEFANFLQDDDADTEIRMPHAISLADHVAENPSPPWHVIVHKFLPPKVSASAPAEAARDRLRAQLADPKMVVGVKTAYLIDYVIAKLYEEAPWMQEVLEYLWQAAHASVAETAGLMLPPVLLVGPPGTGKTYIAERLAERLGLKSARIDCSTATAAFALTGLEFGWRSAYPGEPVRLISETGTANPLIVLDEIDKTPSGGTGGNVAEAALPLLQPSTARRFNCPYLQAPVDLSHVSWVLAANELNRVPAPIRDRCMVFRVKQPNSSDLLKVVRNALDGLEADDVVLRTIAMQIAAGRMSLRSLGRLVRQFQAINQRSLPH
jgi:hypothetical protein